MSYSRIRAILNIRTVAAASYALKEGLQRKAENIIQEGATKQYAKRPQSLETWQSQLDEHMKHALGIGSAPYERIQNKPDDEQEEEKNTHRFS